jgi:hypothetical protein
VRSSPKSLGLKRSYLNHAVERATRKNSQLAAAQTYLGNGTLELR